MRVQIVLAALLSLGASCANAYICPGPDWFYRKGTQSCYFVSMAAISDGWTNEVADHINWDSVAQECQIRGGSIVTIENAEELEWVKAKMPTDTYYWIGLTFENLRWQWYDGKTYRDYTPIPGLTVPTLSATEGNRQRRGSLKYNYNSRKIDFFLEHNTDTNRNGFICKGDYSGRPWCPDGWYYHDGRCHQFNPYGSTFEGARSQCTYRDGYILTVNSQVEDERMKVWLRERAHYEKGWLGVSIANKSASTTAADVKWQDGTPIKDTAIKNWVNSDLDAYIRELPNDNKYCGEITTREGWDDDVWDYVDDHDWRLVADCNQYLPYICEAPLNKCPYGWHHLDDYCYQFNRGQNELMSWQAAREICQRQGGDLINIKTGKVQDYVSIALINEFSFLDTDLQHYWIGLRSSGGRYLWTDGSTLDYSAWSGGLQPSTTNDPCVYIDGNYWIGPGAHGDWNTSVCTQPFGYICQAHHTAAIPPDVTVKPEHSCNGSFEKYHEKCYLFVSTPMNRDDAQRYCRDQGSTLVMIHSFGENTYINGKISADIWIGLKRTGNTGAYDEYTYSNDFLLGQGGFKHFDYNDVHDFNSGQFDKFCVNMAGPNSEPFQAGRWFHSKCTEQRGFVCSHDGTPYPKPYPDNDHTDPLCGGGWFRNGDNCYRVQEFEYETWHSAKQMCHNFNGGSELLYITSKEENQFIRDVLIANYSMGSDWADMGFVYTYEYWIDLYAERPGGWFWPYLDSTDRWTVPFAVSHWAPDQPSEVEFSRNNPRCAIVDDHFENPQWFSYPCNQKKAFICKKVLPSTTLAPTTPQPTAQAGFHLGCAHGWFNENGRCVRFNITGATWSQAKDICRQNKADLVSIQNAQELGDFLRFGGGAWIGLNALNDAFAPRVFTWSNGERVTYTPWDVESGSPNVTGSNSNDANCGALTYTGMAVYPCSEKRTFICERPLENLQGDGSVTIEIPHVPGCRPWGIPYHSHCYYFGEDPSSPYGERKFQSFDAARSFCQTQYGGEMVTIANDDEQDFLSGIVARHASDFWIGLKEESNPWTAFKKWIDGSNVAATNWGFGQPPLTSAGSTGCVAMYGLYGEGMIPGRWYVDTCTERKYALCKAQNTLRPTHQTLPPQLSTPNPNGCPSSWQTNADMPSCYKGYVSPYSATSGAKVNWYQAEEFCRRFRGGHLVSIDTEEENRFIEYTVLSYGQGFSSAHQYWIGMKENENNEYRWEWSDGSPITGEYWHQSEQHHSADVVDCAAINWSNGKWVKQTCQVANGYVCEIPKDAYYENELINVFPTAVPLNRTCGNATLDGEWFYDNVNMECIYWSKKPDTWENAQTACENMDANLVTVTNRSHDFITLKTSQVTTSTYAEDQTYWIGLHMIDMVTREWAWVDGHVSFFRPWAAGRPRNGTERCVAHVSRSGRWEDHNCNRNFRYICSKTGRTRPTRPPRPPGGNCAEGWFAHGEFCYRLSTPSQNLTWLEASNECATARAGLVSVHTSIENDFLITLMKDRNENDFWTGLHAIQGDYDTWYWSDETPFRWYTNWRHGEYDYPSTDYCVAMGSRRNQAGKWYKIKCDQRRGFICKALKDPNLPVQPPPQSACPAEYTQFGTTACYAVRRLEDGRATWQDAQQACKSIGDGHGDLATAEDIFDNAKFRMMLWDSMQGRNHSHHNFTAWIGMKEHLGSFTWFNGCPVVFSNLDSVFLRPRGDACVLMDQHGRWSAQECSAPTTYAVCERRLAACKPAFNLTDNGYCPNDFPHECSNRCFRVEVIRSHNNRTEHVARNLAQQRCQQLNDGHGRLASIRTEEEQRCLERYLDHAVGPMWIGLYEAQRENGDYYWKWEDEGHTYQASSFVNWETGYPTASISALWRDGCVEMKPDGKWVNTECNTYDSRGYVCESRKIHDPTVERTTRNTPPPTIGPSIGPIGQDATDGMSGGTIAGIVIGVLLAVALVGGIGYVVVTGRSGAVVSSVRSAGSRVADSASNRWKGFGNSNYEQQSDKQPVANDPEFNGHSDSYS
ncbi:macrophage mannose receptor 1-like [Paramacrobiotus metropolitanus]|uniref:macrophage mannose receptor 1-like n=1 Tax=Paramacrobiotus metropolitanus TaxID=2943436 RepID=UPI002445B29F|nr:macrophage mannose receptor 1-like [Paramacrobiotus metropolitanus]